ncbi:MAG: TIR domain-containing protein [Flavobacteriales bacterium]
MKRVFIAYSADEEDVKLFQELYLHIGLIRDLDIWHPGKIEPGKNIDEEIQRKFAESTIVLPLMSINYVSDDKCMSLFENATKLQKEVYPILISSFMFEDMPQFSNIEGNIIPEDKRFLKLSENIDAGCTSIVREFKRKIHGGQKSFSILSRSFLKLLIAVPLLCSIAFVVWGLLTALETDTLLIGAFLLACISLIPLVKLLWPSNVAYTKKQI